VMLGLEIAGLAQTSGEAKVIQDVLDFLPSLSSSGMGRQRLSLPVFTN